MPAKVHCSFGVCKSDKRYPKDGVSFFPFPKPCMGFRTSGYSRYFEINRSHDTKTIHRFVREHISTCATCERSEKWVWKCKRKDSKFSSISDIRKDTVICSEHFPPGISRVDLVNYFPGETKQKRESLSSREISRLRAGQTRTTAVDDLPRELTSDLVFTEDSPGPATGLYDDHPPEQDEHQQNDEQHDQEETVILDSVFTEDFPELATGLYADDQPEQDDQPHNNQQDDQQEALILFSPMDAELYEENPDVGERPQLNEGSSSNGVLQQETQTDSPCGTNRSSQTTTVLRMKQETQTSSCGTNCSSQTTTVLRVKQETQTDSSSVTDRSSQTAFTVFDVNKLQRQLSEYKEKVKDLEGTIHNLERQQTKEPSESFEDILKDDPEASAFYTGFTYSQLVGLFQFFMNGVGSSDINYWGDKKFSQPDKKLLTPIQEFIMTMVRLRGGLLTEDIAYRFGISVGIVSQTITTWILIMHRKFKSMRPLMLASREKVKETLPERFKKMKNIRIIIDGAEIFCQSPTDFSQQSNTYSQYKSHNTFKLLLGCTPTGAVCFVSELFEGSISDRQLVIKSGLLDMLEEGDLVLADRGFTLKDIADQKNIDLRIPAFMHGRDKLSPQEEMHSRAIAKCRIFVEHGVRRLKEFRILQRTFPLNMRHVASQIVQVCAYLTNFQQPLDI